MSAMDKVNNILGKLPFVKLAGKIPSGILGKIPVLNTLIPFANHIAVILAAVVLVACFGGGGGVGTASSPGGFTYELTEDGAGVRITGYTSEATKVSVPATIEGYPVTEIGVVGSVDGIFAGSIGIGWDEDRQRWVRTGSTNARNFITSITIPNTVKKIGSYCFAYTSITSFNMPDSVIEIGDGVFDSCKLLTELKLSDNLMMIPERTCYGASSLKKVNLPKNLKIIDDEAFNGCINLTELIIPSTLQSVGFPHVFWDEDSVDIANLDIADVEIGGGHTFLNCGKLPLKTRQAIQALDHTGSF